MNFTTLRYFHARDKDIQLGRRTCIMGIVNVTPDSFSDGGEAFDPTSAVAKAKRLIDEGADIIDIGGESTRPGSESVTEQEELRRVIPVIENLASGLADHPKQVLISIDTCKSIVAGKALDAGAHIINDISGGNFDSDMVLVAAEYSAGVVVMHIQGTPRNMQMKPHYDDLISEIKNYLAESTYRFVEAGVDPSSILVDPGIGFGKTLEHNLDIIAHLNKFKGLGAGVLFGPSRKSFIGKITGKPVTDRVEGTIAAVCAGVINGADIVRVHDVAAVYQAVQVIDAIREYWVEI